ncbi:MAG: thioesterase family protein [Candidatus Binatia bacterium]
MPDSLFVRDRKDASVFHPTELTRGPWVPDAQHGGPPSALLAMALEAHDDAGAPRIPKGFELPMFVARLNVELRKPVPLTPLRLTTKTERPGRKVQVVAASLWSGEVEVATAAAVRIRQARVDIPEGAFPVIEAPAPASSGASTRTPWHHEGLRAFHSDAVDHRFVCGGFDRPGPAVDWIRLRVPLLEGEETPPVARVAAAADFGNGVSWTLSRVDGYQFINPDLTVYLHAYPSGEWVCLDAVTYPQPHGVGLAESRLWGEQGVIGRSLQSLLIEKPG